MNIVEILDGVKNSNKRAIARALSEIENNSKLSEQILDNIANSFGKSYRIGITGPPGAGKSTLTNQLVKLLLEKNYRVGVIAIDPTSPFTGGALLGDRIRMNEIGLHPNVFIRSMATRGSLGGLSRYASEAGDIFDAANFDYTIFETVGVGQSELDVANTVDTTIVVLVPESGDSIQAMKAGLMEIGDIFVMNKSDRAGADNAVASLEFILSFKDHDENTWIPPIVKTIAAENKGTDELFDKITKHREYLIQTNQFNERRLNRIRNRIKELITNSLRKELWTVERNKILDEKIVSMLEGKLKLSEVVQELLENFKNNK